MRRHLWRIGSLALSLAMLSCASPQDAGQPQLSDEELRAKAQDLAHRTLVADGHVDIPYRLEAKWEDISQLTKSGDFDYPRAKRGGLDAPFMSIYVPANYQDTGGAKAYADELIDMVEKFAADWPDKFARADSPAEVRSAFEQGKIALPLGMENGAPVEGSLDNLRHFHRRGIRYVTLTHSRSNHICDSSYDINRQWKGLSPFGREVVAEMNRLGMMIDISHVSDDTFWQVMELSQAPAIASHSSARHFTPNWERNMSDEMIVELAKNGGVILINFASAFLRSDLLQGLEKRRRAIQRHLQQSKRERDDPQTLSWIEQYDRDNSVAFADVSDVADHIDHVRRLTGIDHVGLGSDFDGVGDTLPVGLKDVSQYPNLFFELLKRGYTEEEIEKVASGNLLRVWSEVERKARELQGSSAD